MSLQDPPAAAAAIVVMGRRIRIEGDDPGLVTAALFALGAEPIEDGRPARTIIRLASADAIVGDGEVALAVDGRRLRLSGGAEGEADADARTAWCRVPARCVADPPALRGLLETILLFLLARDGLVPLHASAFLVGDTAILLAGRSGAGKSSLALAALEAGRPVLAEDMVHVELEPRLRVWGLPSAIHLLPADAPPGSDGPLRLRGARRKRGLPIPAAARADCAERAILCVLERGDRVGLVPISSDAARDALSSLEPGFDLLRDETRRAVAALAAEGAWRLTLSASPGEAVALLAEAFGRGGPPTRRV